MAFDIAKGAQLGRDWSCGISELPKSAKGYIPETFWGASEMEQKLSELMSQRAWGFGPKPDRKEALKQLVSYMKANKIGPKDIGSGIGAEVGSIFFPQKAADKIDDLRYDVRKTGASVSGAVYALSGAFAFLAFAKIYKNAHSRAQHGG